MLLIDELDKVDQGFEPDASTNLFIWTTSERLNYELEPAGAVATMDFAVDQVPLPTVAPTPTNVLPPPLLLSEFLLFLGGLDQQCRHAAAVHAASVFTVLLITDHFRHDGPASSAITPTSCLPLSFKS